MHAYAPGGNPDDGYGNEDMDHDAEADKIGANPIYNTQNFKNVNLMGNTNNRDLRSNNRKGI